jgi:Tfp pilus assembly protein PilO
MNHRQKIQVSTTEQKIVWILLAVFLLLSFSYGFFINQTILNVVSRKNSEKTILNIYAQVSDQETKFMNLKNSVNLDMAREMGYISLSDVNYISLSRPQASLSISQ